MTAAQVAVMEAQTLTEAAEEAVKAFDVGLQDDQPDQDPTLWRNMSTERRKELKTPTAAQVRADDADQRRRIDKKLKDRCQKRVEVDGDGSCMYNSFRVAVADLR